MMSWIILFLPISQAVVTNIEVSPGENAIINCTLSVHPDESSLIFISWMWKPADEVADIEIFLHHGESFTQDNTRFSNRLIGAENAKDGDVSILLKNITLLDSGIFTCVDRSGLQDRVISQPQLRVRPPEGHDTKMCPTGNAVPWIITVFLIVIIMVLVVVVIVMYKKSTSHVPQNLNVEG
uniref:Ig-like domain-containing protein n=1 Tax=Eptatretus burgeri TaxID=7764 RepID=A0A8C4Q5H4_EPTBU